MENHGLTPSIKKLSEIQRKSTSTARSMSECYDITDDLICLVEEIEKKAFEKVMHQKAKDIHINDIDYTKAEAVVLRRDGSREDKLIDPNRKDEYIKKRIEEIINSDEEERE